MNRNQKYVFNWLQQAGPGLAEVYEGAVNLLENVENANFPGRGWFVCHAVREIRNRLADKVAGEFDIKRLDYTREVEGLAKVWESAGLEGVYEKQGAGQAEQAVPREVVVLVDSLVKKHRKVAYTNRQKARMLVVELEPDNKALQVSLYPVADEWFRESEWFVKRAHVGRDIENDNLVTHFQRFENVLYSLIGYFYEGMEAIERITNDANKWKGVPDGSKVSEAVLRLVRLKYQRYFFHNLDNHHWVKPLKEKGFFKCPEDPNTGEVYQEWAQGRYLKKMASKVPDEVLDVIKVVKSQNPFVRGVCLDCLLEMPDNIAAKGIGVVKTFLSERQYAGPWGFFWGGKQCAELMVKLVDKYRREAFKIAGRLFDLWRPGKKEAGIFETIRSRFAAHEYKDLMFGYYKKVWEKRPFEATRLLVDIYDRYVEECIKEKGYDTSEYFGVSVEDLQNIERMEYDIDAIVMKGICEAGRAVREKQPGKISGLLEDLEKRNKGIFHRVEMYLLRFVAPGTQTEKINKLISNPKFMENRLYWHEHRHLLNDKFEEVSEETRKQFIAWVQKQTISQERREEIEEYCRKNNEQPPDFGKWESQAKAEELYIVRDKFKELYEGYKKAAGLNDGQLVPRRTVGEVGFVSPMQGSPLQPEEMAKMKVGEVLDYILEPKNYEVKKKPGEWIEPKEALAATFKEDVKKRAIEYLKEGKEKLANLPAGFLSEFFYGVSESVRANSFAKEGWGDFIDFAHKLAQGKHKEQEYRNCLSVVLSTLRDGFGDRDVGIEFDEGRARKVWEVLEVLVYSSAYDTSTPREEGTKEDPIHTMVNLVAGQAMELTELLGIVCKDKLTKFYESFLRAKMRECWNFVVDKIRQPGVNCAFGVNFARICWLDEEWVQTRAENIFCEELWDETWGTYVSWGRPSAQCFRILVGQGMYGRAVELLGQGHEYGYKYGKKPDEGLLEHLMIGFFNGWIEFEDAVLKRFFENATAELRAKAAKFLTTGFKAVNEKGGTEKENVAARMREYWNKRLAAIKDNAEKDEKEAMELTGWVGDSVLPAKETLELLEKSLNLSGGKIGTMGDARDFVQGVCRLGEDNELLALRCLKKAAVDENMHTPLASIQDPLVKFLETMVKSPENIRSEAKEVADLYGRYNPDKFHRVWEKLDKGK